MSQAWTPVLIGGIIGVSGAAIGAIVDLWYSRRRGAEGASLGGFLLIIAGIINTLAGITALVLSFILTGSLRLGILLGLGVLAGFILGFILLAVIWIWK